MIVTNSQAMPVPMTIHMTAQFTMSKDDTGYSAVGFSDFEKYLREKYPNARITHNSGSTEYTVEETLLALKE